ncbi:MAG TPA: aspartyl protease family protein [Steroidobacteraceae bacterium]|nr:aspartyl protease family protein [Steroidobacteraceae bacterium]
MQQGWRGAAALIALLAAALPQAEATSTVPMPNPVPASSAPAELPIPEISITAPEPRYVAPTLRDRIGRIWAPVYLNGKGPFRLVLDTGASHSAVISQVAAELGLPPSGAILLHGVTGSATVGYVTVNTFVVGDMESHDEMLPIVPDALGGADGVLGTQGLSDKRIYIDFMHDKISIMHSHMTRAETGFATIPLTRTANGLLEVKAFVRGIRVNAIIDTGGQATVANLALLEALETRHRYERLTRSSITGATDDVQSGEDSALPSVNLGPVTIHAAYITFSDLDIFERWHMTNVPTMLIGIDTLGLLDVMVIDYRRMELQVRTRHN